MREIQVGLAGGVSMLRTHVGRLFARRMSYTGMRVSAPDLHRRGVLHAVLPLDPLMDEPLAAGVRFSAPVLRALRCLAAASRMATCPWGGGRPPAAGIPAATRQSARGTRG